jgi:preprotein translocase subunit SecE
MMNKQMEVKHASSFDWLKWLFIVACVAAGVWANYHYSQIDWSLRLAGWIVLTCLLLFVALQTVIGHSLWRFVKEARGELRKVVWPTRPETVQTTLIVVAMVIVMSLILWGLDSILLWIVGLLTGQK